jgi:hypothetical protein
MTKLLIGVMALTLLVTFAIAQKKSSPEGTLASLQRNEEASQEVVKTLKQVEHSKLYKEFKKKKNLHELTSSGDVRLLQTPPLGGEDPLAPPFVLADYLRKQACDSDAVIVGRINERTSFLTDDETFIFSDHTVVVEEVLKGNSSARFQLGDILTVTRPGGKIKLNNGRMAEIAFSSFEPFRTGERYLLFIRYIPSTKAYQVKEGEQAFLLRDNKVFKRTGKYLGSEISSMDEVSFLNQVRGAASSGCEGGKREGGKNE